MRKYLPTLGELIDRLTIVQLKEVKIPEHKEQYQKEIKDIVHDITEILTTTKQLKIDGDFIRAIIVLSQMNTHIWYNEDIRSGENVANDLLLTHGLNGIRNTQRIKYKKLMVVEKITKSIVLSEFKDWEISW